MHVRFLCLLLLVPSTSFGSVIWFDDFSDGDISDWVPGENGHVWTVQNGELLQPDTQYFGNSVLTYGPISWGEYVLEWEMRPIAKADGLGPVCWAQSGPAAGGFDWDCSLDVNGVPSAITLCGELGQTYRFRVETVGGIASLEIDGQFIGSGPYDPDYSSGFIVVNTNSTSVAYDNFVLSTYSTTATEKRSWTEIKQLFR